MCLKVFDRESVFEKEFVSQDREREREYGVMETECICCWSVKRMSL